MTDKDSDLSQDDWCEDGWCQDNRILCWIPTGGIDLDVIKADLHSYLGQDATVKREEHPMVGVDKQELG